MVHHQLKDHKVLVMDLGRYLKIEFSLFIYGRSSHEAIQRLAPSCIQPVFNLNSTHVQPISWSNLFLLLGTWAQHFNWRSLDPPSLCSFCSYADLKMIRPYSELLGTKELFSIKWDSKFSSFIRLFWNHRQQSILAQ